MTKYCSSIVFIFFLATCLQASTPFIANESYWGTFKDQVVVNCQFDACFPKTLDAPLACDTRCLFTTKGFGVPEAVTRAFNSKTPVAHGQKPTFIVAYGPAGSGKSSILPLLVKSFPHFTHLDETTVSVNVDDIFQGGEVGLLYKKYRDAIIAHTKSAEQRQLYTQRLYAYYRWVADQISDGILNQALAGRYNVIWETTGTSTWPRHEIARINRYGYDTMVIYPFVETEALVERTKNRAQLSGQEAMPEQQLRDSVDAAQINLIDLLPKNAHIAREACPVSERFDAPNNQDVCRAKRVVLIDNSGESGQSAIALDTDACQHHCDVQNRLNLGKPLEEAIQVLSPCPKQRLDLR